MLWWGQAGKAELDLVLYRQVGPVLLVSCKRTELQQSAAAFIPHIQELQVCLKGVLERHVLAMLGITQFVLVVRGGMHS